jgi:hypothetical protein
MTATSHERLARLEREAAEARAALAATLAEVRRRLEPERLKQDAETIGQQYMERARQAGLRVVRERRLRLQDKVVDAAINNPAPALALGTLVGWPIWRRVSQIPPPILLVCAGGIAGLMRRGDGTGQRLAPPDRYLAHPERYGDAEPGRSMAGREWSGAAASSVGATSREAAARARGIAHETGTRVSAATAQAGAAVSDVAERTAAGFNRAAGGAAATAGDLGRQARNQFAGLLNRHPLVLGAIGLALGAAIAASLRPTETEARLVGETSDAFKRRARELVEDQLGRAQTIAGRAYEAGSNEAREQGLPVNAVRESVAKVGERLGASAETGREEAEEADEVRVRSPTA